jgi:predicted transcriptional regulator
MMSGYGLVVLTKKDRDIQPTALATEFIVLLD